MLENEETSALCALATEFANVARLYARAAGRADERDAQALRHQSEVRQTLADRIVADFAPYKMPAGGSWLPSPEELEFRLKSMVDQRWARRTLDEADQQLFVRIRDLLVYGKPSDRAVRVIRQARSALGAHVVPVHRPRADDQPG